MNNIFEGAKFGDKFLTIDGKTAIFDTELSIAPYVYLLIEGEHNLFEYDYEGICQMNGASYYNIVSRYQEPIDEEKLAKVMDELNVQESSLLANTKYRKLNEFEKQIFMTGYRKAIEG